VFQHKAACTRCVYTCFELLSEEHRLFVYINVTELFCNVYDVYRGADKSLARPGWKQARKHVRDARDFNNIETRAIIKFFFSCKARRRRKFTQPTNKGREANKV